jgi:hypothetical protein
MMKSIMLNLYRKQRGPGRAPEGICPTGGGVQTLKVKSKLSCLHSSTTGVLGDYITPICPERRLK